MGFISVYNFLFYTQPFFMLIFLELFEMDSQLSLGEDSEESEGEDEYYE